MSFVRIIFLALFVLILCSFNEQNNLKASQDAFFKQDIYNQSKIFEGQIQNLNQNTSDNIVVFEADFFWAQKLYEGMKVLVEYKNSKYKGIISNISNKFLVKVEIKNCKKHLKEGEKANVEVDFSNNRLAYFSKDIANFKNVLKKIKNPSF